MKLSARTGIILVLFASSALRAQAPTFQSLMDPTIFPDPQCGMRVEGAEIEGPVLNIRTTGAVLTFDTATGIASFQQRIGQPREVVRLQIGDGPLGRPRLTHRGQGLAFAEFSAPRFNLRANGDSLFMLHALEPLKVTVRRSIEPGFSSSWKTNHILLDEYGGFGLYCSQLDLADGFDPYEPVTATYRLPAGAVLWIGICPPKPFDWERSFKDHVVWHWSNTLGYPPDDLLAAWSKEGNIVLLQAEVMLWKDWNLAFEPRLGPAEFARVRETVHRHGMRFIVYTSPFYFLRNTPLEKHAFNSFVNFTNWPPGTPTGENIEQFMAEIERLLKTHRPDGLYFDGQYIENPAALYALARRTRALLGEDGILEWHSTQALGSELCFLPQADAYVDFILRGEGRDGHYDDLTYLRYFVSGYNTSNSIGVLCNNGPRPTPELLRRLLAVNGRIHTIVSWLTEPKLTELIRTDYHTRLTPALREEVERGIRQRQAELPIRARAIQAERRALSTQPAWDEPGKLASSPPSHLGGQASCPPVLAESFDAPLDGWSPSVSPLNQAPFTFKDGALLISAKAHTYAYFTHTLDRPIQGFVVQLRQDTDAGQSWGPAICVRWKTGQFLRLGVRSDGLIQADINGNQLLGGRYARGRSIWLRARWLKYEGVIEASDDGRTFERIWHFHPTPLMNANAESVSAGKVPYNGQPIDHEPDPGPAGTCAIEDLRLY
ncbi:MAG TPA: hypothetical protein PK579_02945 [Phycisphaerae bacterium]|nr:hypothetical protein [Phycisphaerae bacterium]